MADGRASVLQQEAHRAVTSGSGSHQTTSRADSESEGRQRCRPALQEHGVVYNFSFQFKGHNLNELLQSGPTVGPSLLAVLLRFWHSAATTGECFIRTHYFCDSSGETSKQDSPPEVHEWQVLPFGTTCIQPPTIRFFNMDRFQKKLLKAL